uniref:Ubiquitin-like protease family profile domain-containing protein n=1 Tax=Arundo donax TaxID=35708 RepID=A0A0A8Y6P3_ARUDO
MFLKWHKAAICEARLICLPFLYAQHWTYLCLNMENQHVYILDSTNKKHCTFEERALRHLEAELVKIWPERPAFTRWPRTFVETQYQEEDDCGIHVMKFLENWNGTGFDEPIDPRKAQDYRLEYLTRMLYHERNLNHHSVDDLLHSTVHGDAGETQTGQGSTDLPGRRTVDQQEEQTTEQPHREEQDQNISKITVLESLDGAGGLQPSQGSNE